MAPQNPLQIHGNEKTMNMNHLILTNIQSSPYFKVNLYELKTYHEVIDEIYYKVGHLEPWEKGSRKTAGQTGMCGGVRGVGAGGIVSSAFCLLYKLFTLRLTRKQVNGLITHQDSPYIRCLGFMYIRYTQNPADLWEWYADYMDDDEEVDVKAGGGHTMVIGEMLRQWMTKLEWYSTLFPRIPVPIQKEIEMRLRERDAQIQRPIAPAEPEEHIPDDEVHFGEAERVSKLKKSDSPNPRSGRPSPPFDIAKEIAMEKERQSKDVDKGRDRYRSQDQEERRRRSNSKDKRRSRSRDRHRSRSRDRHRSRSRDRRRSRSRERNRSRSHDRRRSRSRERSHREKKRSRSRETKTSRSKDVKRRSRSRDRKSSRDRKRSRSRSRDRSHKEQKHSRSHDKHKHKKRGRSRERSSRENSFERDLRREKERQSKSSRNGD